jgi:hypothetical protein
MRCTACGGHRGGLSLDALRSIADTVAEHGRADLIPLYRDTLRAERREAFR